MVIQLEIHGFAPMNFDHVAKREVIAGMSGSGKTSLYLSMFKKSKARYKFSFDPDREMSRKLGLPISSTLDEMKNALKLAKPVLFDPHAMFPAQYNEAIAFFFRWIYECCKVLQGKKLVAVDEIQKWTRTGIGGVPRSMIEVLDAGRREEIDLMFVVNKGLNKLSDEIRGQLTDIYAFKTVDKAPLKWLEEEGFTKEQILNLPSPGGYIHKTL